VLWPFAEMLGMRPKSIGEGRARFELEVAARHLNPNGTLIQASRG
jgi:acyl-coenzyme A thioesterase PaaI-like protein